MARDAQARASSENEAWCDNMSCISGQNKGRRIAVVAVLLVLLVFLVANSGLRRSFLDNVEALRLSRAAPRVTDAGDYRYGAGLRKVSDAQAGAILWRSLGSSSRGSACSPEEKHLAKLGAIGETPVVEAASSYLRPLLAIRQGECVGDSTEPSPSLSSVLTDSRLDVLKAQLYMRQGRTDEAITVALPYLCPTGAPWCQWCVTGGPQHEQAAVGENDRPKGPPSSSNAHESQALTPDDSTLGPLFWREIQNLTKEQAEPLMLTSGVPIIVANAVPASQGDNYLEYNSVPVQNPLVRFRIRGAVLGSDPSSCIAPRMVFWSAGEYLGETREFHRISDRFEIDLWTKVPANTTTVTPRLTFDHACFAKGQRIVVCSAELAVGSRQGDTGRR